MFNIHHPGEVLKIDRQNYVDQLNRSKSFSCYIKDSYLFENYQLSWQDYINLILYGDIDYKHYCKGCNIDLTDYFFGRKLQDRYYPVYCGHSCRATYEITDQFKYAPAPYPDHFMTVDSKAKSEYTKRLKLYNERDVSEVSIYIADIQNPYYLKLGVSYNLKRRSNFMEIYNYRSIEEIRTDTPELILALERDLKLQFVTNEDYKFNTSSEMFKYYLKQDVINFIKNYKL